MDRIARKAQDLWARKAATILENKNDVAEVGYLQEQHREIEINRCGHRHGVLGI